MSEVVPTRVVVETKSIWWSKIFWTQLVAIVSMALTVFGGFEISPQTQLEIVSAVLFVQGGVTMVFKTFFTSTVTPSSVPPNLMRE